MVSISHETAEHCRDRLLKVITQCEVKVYCGGYAFYEFPLNEFSDRADSTALALVRDDEVWSQLLPCSDESEELFAVFRFHFPAAVDNSGFVGWLATHIKDKFGSGVFVICGQNSKAGGIFDYWGCPYELGKEVLQEIDRLVSGESTVTNQL